MNERNVIAVDLDGTLAQDIAHTPYEIGPPVPEMLERVRKWVEDGEEVWILTSRMTTHDITVKTMRQVIQDWLEENGLPRLPVTGIKSYRIRELWDDRAVAVVPNTGHPTNEPFRTED